MIAQSSSSGGGTTGGVKCRCGAVYGKGCKADNSGSTCTTVTEQCWTYNQNCSNWLGSANLKTSWLWNSVLCPHV